MKSHSIADYDRYSSKLREIMGPHIASLPKAGPSVLLNFEVNTVGARG